MAREIQVDMSRESVDLEDLSSRLAHKKVCNINLKRNQNTLLKGLEVINELVKSGRLHAEGEYEIIRTPERLKEVMETYLTGVSEYVLDVETTGLDVYNDILVGICLYNPDLPSFYVPFNHTDLQNKRVEGQMTEEECKAVMLPYLANGSLKCINHNIKFDDKFNMEIPIGSRFNLNELNYVATAFIESADGYFYYQMECETEGTNGNKFFGELSSIEYIDKDLTGELTELLIPAEDEEDTEALRTRYLNSFDSNPFGGNKQDYVEKTDALDGVGGTVVIPVWSGGGTVKLIIINSDFGVASSTLVKAVQEAIDPDPQGTGSGIAPIGHTVTVVSAVGKTVSIKSRITLNDGYQWSQVKPKAEETLEAYFLEMRKNWEKGNLVVRISQIENRLLNLDGILDVADTQLNDVASNLALAQEEIPLLGGVYIG